MSKVITLNNRTWKITDKATYDSIKRNLKGYFFYKIGKAGKRIYFKELER